MSILKVDQIDNNTPNTAIVVTGGAGTSGMGSSALPILSTDFTNKAFVDAEIVAVNAAKEPNIPAGTTAQYLRGDKSFQTLNKGNVAGLTDADNPSFNTIVSTVATGTAPFTVASTTQVANLYAEKADEAAKVIWGHNSIATDTAVSTSSDVDTLITGLAFTPTEAGTYQAQFNSQFDLTSDFITAQGATDLIIAHATISGETGTATHPIGFVTETLTAGIYDITGAGTLAASSTLTLDAQGDPNAIFIFRFSTTFTAGASAIINLFDGASACNVFFITNGAMNIAATSTMHGTFIANNGIVTVGGGTTVNGRLFSTAGAINMTTATVIAPISCSYLDIGVLDSFAIFTNNGNIASTGASIITGDVGTNLGAYVTFTTSTVSGQQYTSTSRSGHFHVSFYINNALVPYSERTRSNLNSSADIALLSVITSTGGQVIDVRWRAISGSVSLSDRIFSLTRVA
jgi:hypothetical protein